MEQINRCKHLCDDVGSNFKPQIIVISTLEELRNCNIKKALDPQYRCNICGKKYSSKSVLKTHQIRHKKRESLPFTCLICPYRSATKSDLVRHHLRHHEYSNPAYKCDCCEHTFKTSDSLSDHMKSVHIKDVIYRCGKVQCSFSTSRRSSIRMHLKSHVSPQLKFICPICEALFQNKANLRTHLMTHADVRPFTCTKCGKSFAFSSRLSDHQRIVHGPKKFKCDVCQKRFPNVHRLKRHSLIHTEEKPFKCCFCSYASNAHGNLVKHVRKVHKKLGFTYKDILVERGIKKDLKKEMDPDEYKQLSLRSEKVSESVLEKLKEKGLTNVTLRQMQKNAEINSESKGSLSSQKRKRTTEKKPQKLRVNFGLKADKSHTRKKSNRRHYAADSCEKSDSFDLSACEDFILPHIEEANYAIQSNGNYGSVNVVPAYNMHVIWSLTNIENIRSNRPALKNKRKKELIAPFSKDISKIQQVERESVPFTAALSNVNSPFSILDENYLNFTDKNLILSQMQGNDFASVLSVVDSHLETTLPTGTSNVDYDVPICVLCLGPHSPLYCTRYRSPVGRRKIAKQRGLCITCLKKHSTKLCQSTNRCHRCGQWHHDSLCRYKGYDKQNSLHAATTSADSVPASLTVADSFDSRFSATKIHTQLHLELDPSVNTITHSKAQYATLLTSKGIKELNYEQRPLQQSSDHSVIARPFQEVDVDHFSDFEDLDSRNTIIITSDSLHEYDGIYRNLDLCNQFLHMSEDDPSFICTTFESSLTEKENYKTCQSKVGENCNGKLKKNETSCTRSRPLLKKSKKEHQVMPRKKLKSNNKFSRAFHLPYLELGHENEASSYPNDLCTNKLTRSKHTTLKCLKKELKLSATNSYNPVEILHKPKGLELTVKKREKTKESEEIIVAGEESCVDFPDEALSHLSAASSSDNANQQTKQIIIKDTTWHSSPTNNEVVILSIAEVEVNDSEVVLEIG